MADPGVFRRQLSGQRLVAARVAWLLVVVPTLAVAAYGFAAGFADLTILGPPSVFAAVAQAGVDPAVGVVVGLVLPLVLISAIGAVMVWKKPADPMVLLTSLMLITIMTTFTKSTFAAMSTVPELEGIVRAVFFIGFGSFVLVFTLFPNGHSVPSWAWISAPVVGIVVVALPGLSRVLAMFPDRPPDFDEGIWTLDLTLVVGVLSFAAICQVYRYRKVSTHPERLQAKWLILPLGITTAQFVLIFVLSQPVFELAAWSGMAQLSLIPTTLMFPIGVAAAILRYRLYDIERIVSRTVSYGLLTVLLFSIYAALVFALRQLMPMQGDLAVAGSTLGVAALANPMRRRLQRLVDLRFNRTHTDAARTLSGFTSMLRTSSDFTTVATELERVVVRTFQPDRLSVWVRSG